MNRITLDPEQCGGRPCIRGMRIRVTDVLDLLSNGLTSQQVLEELPDPAVLIMDEMGTPGEGTRPTRGRFCRGCRPGALTRRGATGP